MRATLYALLGLVAVAAAVSSFSALHGLAVLCGFGWTAPLLPLVVDVGAGAGTLVWLTRGPDTARAYGRALALTLLGLSVAGNALAHGLAAAGLRPHWLVVVAVSAVAPAVLGAVVHLAVLAGRATTDEPTGDEEPETDEDEDEDEDEPDREPDQQTTEGEPPAELTTEAEVALIERLAVAQAGGQKLPSNRGLCREHGIGRDRAARILRAAADRSVWVRKQRSAVGS